MHGDMQWMQTYIMGMEEYTLIIVSADNVLWQLTRCNMIQSQYTIQLQYTTCIELICYIYIYPNLIINDTCGHASNSYLINGRIDGNW